jgi:hypothetical protein
LRNFISIVVALPNSDWEDLEKATVIMKPLALATDVCQKDASNVATVLNELRKLPDHFLALGADDPSLQEFCRKAQVRMHFF